MLNFINIVGIKRNLAITFFNYDWTLTLELKCYAIAREKNKIIILWEKKRT